MEILKPYRRRIDALDDQIIDLLAERMGIIDEVAELKAARDIPAVLEGRVNEVLDRTAARAGEKGVDPELARRLYAVLVAWSCEREEAFIKAKAKK